MLNTGRSCRSGVVLEDWRRRACHPPAQSGMSDRFLDSQFCRSVIAGGHGARKVEAPVLIGLLLRVMSDVMEHGRFYAAGQSP